MTVHDTTATIFPVLDAGRIVRVETRKYVVGTLINAGGTGEVYEATDDLGQRVALKLYLPPSHLIAQDRNHSQTVPNADLVRFVSEITKYAQAEHESLSSMDHPNVVRIITAGSVSLSLTERNRAFPPHLRKDLKQLPVMVTEFIDGLQLERALSEMSLRTDEVARTLGDIAEALDYVHSRHKLHCDVRASNIMIRDSDHRAVLIDFALAKDLEFPPERQNERTLLGVDTRLLSPDIPQTDPLKRNSGLVELTRQQLLDNYFPWLDTLLFGEMLKEIRPMLQGHFDSSELEYLDIILQSLGGTTAARKWNEKPVGPLARRLSALHSYPYGVQELVTPAAAKRTISLPGGVTVPASGLAAKVIVNRSFGRLSSIQQLSLLSYVYPGADYKRVVHALDAYEVARQLVGQLLGTPRFRSIFDDRSARDLLVCSLLHDINHFPFLHVFQEVARPDASALLDNREVVDFFCNGRATGENANGEESVYEILAGIDLDADRFNRLVYGKHRDQNTAVDQVINSVVSSGLDIDKLSYLRLDSLFTGVSFGSGIDLPTLLKAATIALIPNDRYHLAFEDRALQAMENVFLTRFWNFRSIYWHHTNRALMSMLLTVVRKLYLGEPAADPFEYVRATRSMTDVEALRWLDGRHREAHGSASLLGPVLESRGGLYRRLYSTRPLDGKDEEAQLATDLRSIVTGVNGFGREILLRTALAEHLQEEYGVPVKLDDLLLDVPRRTLDDSGGPAYVTLGGSVHPLRALSKPVDTLTVNYALLAQKVRFFVSPRLSAVFTRERREMDRERIRLMILESMHTAQAGVGIG